MILARIPLTAFFKCTILTSVNRLQKLARPVIGGVPAGTPFNIYTEVTYVKAIHDL